MRNRLLCLLTTIALAGCATPEEREVAALEEELGLDVAPYFPKCLSEEVSPRAAVRAGDYNIAHTVNNLRAMLPSINVRDGKPMSRLV